MGRALVRDPKIFLFDEPLSNLDAKLRVEKRTERDSSESGYLNSHQLPAARRILKAVAWTYVAASLPTLLNFRRWITVPRR
jgi:ABC-type sulfate/molybdate transport systems ATPase subunit